MATSTGNSRGNRVECPEQNRTSTEKRNNGFPVYPGSGRATKFHIFVNNCKHFHACVLEGVELLTLESL